MRNEKLHDHVLDSLFYTKNRHQVSLYLSIPVTELQLGLFMARWTEQALLCLSNRSMPIYKL